MCNHVPGWTLHVQRRSIPYTVRWTQQCSENVPRQTICQFFTRRFALYYEHVTYCTGSANHISLREMMS
jgi:hypothetical protein